MVEQVFRFFDGFPMIQFLVLRKNVQRLDYILLYFFVDYLDLLGEFVEYVNYELAQKNDVLVLMLVDFQFTKITATGSTELSCETLQQFGNANCKFFDLCRSSFI